MKTIHDKLKPDILASIKADKKTYPYTTKALIKELKGCIDWSQLSINAVSSIILHSHVKIIDLVKGDSVGVQDLLWGDKFLTE
tara:strand:+ start:52 stop:300 length:249 start_codon:yes stop_codon:yes gene_type:complete